ncbi:MAG: hypothetical protein KIT58_13665 [Planctomycetota bacterium]|nr:hypothetical protein [Planctomycetota bacterium]
MSCPDRPRRRVVGPERRQLTTWVDRADDVLLGRLSRQAARFAASAVRLPAARRGPGARLL